MKRKAAVIDMGTNTFHLLLVQLNEDHYDILYKEKIPVKIGEGGINHHIILPEAQVRALHTLTHFQNLIQGEQIEETFVFATSAVRNATNGLVFVQRIQKQLGLEVNIIDGNREAELIYKGIKLSGCLTREISLMTDIGGGSVEFIIGNQEEILWKQSFEIGGQRMLDLFHYHDPILKEEVNKLFLYLNENLADLREAISTYQPSQLIGASGTFDTLMEIYLAKICQGKPKYPQILSIPDNDFNGISDQLIRLNKAERLKIPGMIPMRVDMIVVACCLINYIFKFVDTNSLVCSTYALKEGVIAELIQKKTTNGVYIPSWSWQ